MSGNYHKGAFAPSSLTVPTRDDDVMPNDGPIYYAIGAVDGLRRGIIALANPVEDILHYLLRIELRGPRRYEVIGDKGQTTLLERVERRALGWLLRSSDTATSADGSDVLAAAPSPSDVENLLAHVATYQLSDHSAPLSAILSQTPVRRHSIIPEPMRIRLLEPSQQNPARSPETPTHTDPDPSPTRSAVDAALNDSAVAGVSPAVSAAPHICFIGGELVCWSPDAAARLKAAVVAAGARRNRSLLSYDGPFRVSTFDRTLAGRRKPSMRELLAICAACRVDPVDILHGPAVSTEAQA